jgi:hypothetical protein
MPGDRPNIAMTDQEADDFLAGADEMVVAYVRPDGWPVAFAGHSGYDAGRITVTFDDPTGTADGIAENDAVCCVAEESSNYDEIKGVIVHGDITAVAARAGAWRWTVQPRRTTSFDFARFRKPVQ